MITVFSPELAKAVAEFVDARVHEVMQYRTLGNGVQFQRPYGYVGKVTEEISEAVVGESTFTVGRGKCDIYVRNSNNDRLEVVFEDVDVFNLSLGKFTDCKTWIPLRCDPWGDWYVGELVKARWIVVTVNTYEDGLTEPALVDFWEGHDPTNCDEEITLFNPFGEELPCDLCDEKLLCCYRPEEDDYAIVSSESGILGAPKDLTLITSDLTRETCTLKWDSQTVKGFPCAHEPECEAEPDEKSLSLADQTLQVLTTPFELGSEGLCAGVATVYVCNYGGVDTACIPAGPCCTETLYHYLSTYGDPSPGGTEVGYIYDGVENPVYEKCFERNDDTTGWIEGAWDDTVDSFYVREVASPICCEDSPYGS